MVSEYRRFHVLSSNTCRGPSSRSWALAAKDHPAEFIAEALGFLGSEASQKRSASSKNSCCLRFSASMPFSMSSTSMRLELSLRVFARLPDLGCGGRREADVLTHGLVCEAHDTIMYDNGGLCLELGGAPFWVWLSKWLRSLKNLALLSLCRRGLRPLCERNDSSASGSVPFLLGNP